MDDVPSRVVIASGHRTDARDRLEPRFPEAAVEGVKKSLEAVLRRWGIGRGDLLVTGGARGADILAAEAALERGAAVALLLALPVEEFLDRSIRLERGVPDTWERRFRALLERAEVRIQEDELGPPAEDENRFARNNRWTFEYARARAGGKPLLGLLVWDGRDEGDGPGGTADVARRLALDGEEVAVVDPREGIAA